MMFIDYQTKLIRSRSSIMTMICTPLIRNKLFYFQGTGDIYRGHSKGNTSDHIRRGRIH